MRRHLRQNDINVSEIYIRQPIFFSDVGYPCLSSSPSPCHSRNQVLYIGYPISMVECVGYMCVWCLTGTMSYVLAICVSVAPGRMCWLYVCLWHLVDVLAIYVYVWYLTGTWCI